MTQMKDLTQSRSGTRLTLAEVFESLLARPVPVRFTAYDGSSYGPEDAAVTLDRFHLRLEIVQGQQLVRQP